MSFTNEKIIETKKCKLCFTQFEITDKDLEFYDKVSPIFNGEKYTIPTPKLCPKCREQRRLSWYNESKLYKSKCGVTGKNIISMISPDKKYDVYDINEWLKDSFEPFNYGKEFDFNRNFFEQFHEILQEVPMANRDVFSMQNSDYTNYAGYLKECYLIFQSDDTEECLYGNMYLRSKKSLDCLGLIESENCYECIDCVKCFSVQFSINSVNCNNSYFLKNCENCSNCFGCINLVNKSYYFLNNQLTKEQYLNRIEALSKLPQSENNTLHQKIKNLYNEKPLKNLNNVNSYNTFGERNYNSKNINFGYDNIDVEDGSYIYGVKGGKDVYDIYCFGLNLSKSYEGLIVGNDSSSILFSISSWKNVNNILYSYFCIIGCKNCFGCIGLKNKEYCIFNKQYTKEEYNILVPKIINHMKETGEWGEFFPSNISPFGYNETVAQEYFPLSKQEARDSGFNWSDYEVPFPKVEKVIPASKLPNNISDIPDDILNWAIECEVTKKPFKIIPQELKFYRKHNLPIPRRHPDQRYLDRMKIRNPRKLFERDCDKCGTQMQTTYSPEREEMVYCEECYNKEVY